MGWYVIVFPPSLPPPPPPPHPQSKARFIDIPILPRALLCSVPLIVSTAGNSGATVVSLPTAGVTVSPSTGTVSHAAEASLHNITVPPAESPVTAVSLSPATEPFPMKLVEKIRSGRFVEMRELLTDNVSLLQQLDALNVQCALPILPGVKKPRLREVTTLSWMYCFLAYTALRSSDQATTDRLAYARLVIHEAQRQGGSGWLDYDQVLVLFSASCIRYLNFLSVLA